MESDVEVDIPEGYLKFNGSASVPPAIPEGREDNAAVVSSIIPPTSQSHSSIPVLAVHHVTGSATSASDGDRDDAEAEAMITSENEREVLRHVTAAGTVNSRSREFLVPIEEDRAGPRVAGAEVPPSRRMSRMDEDLVEPADSELVYAADEGGHDDEEGDGEDVDPGSRVSGEEHEQHRHLSRRGGEEHDGDYLDEDSEDVFEDVDDGEGEGDHGSREHVANYTRRGDDDDVEDEVDEEDREDEDGREEEEVSAHVHGGSV